MPNIPNLERTLILETSGNVGRVGLASGNRILIEDSLSRERRRASDLALQCHHLLAAQGWKAADLTAVIVSMGPGSYTALRVGVASAKILAYATGAAFIGVETFAAYACQSTFRDMTVIADALQGEVYARRYMRDENGLRPISELQISKLTEILKETQRGTQLIGPGLTLLAKIGVLVEETPEPLKLSSLLETVTFHHWAIETDMWTAEPYYLRGSSAEEKRFKETSAS